MLHIKTWTFPTKTETENLMTDVKNCTSRFEIVCVDRVYWPTKSACYGLTQDSVMLSVWHTALIVRRLLLASDTWCQSSDGHPRRLPHDFNRQTATLSVWQTHGVYRSTATLSVRQTHGVYRSTATLSVWQTHGVYRSTATLSVWHMALIVRLPLLWHMPSIVRGHVWRLTHDVNRQMAPTSTKKRPLSGWQIVLIATLPLHVHTFTYKILLVSDRWCEP
jgi:hypothetical protein